MSGGTPLLRPPRLSALIAAAARLDRIGDACFQRLTFRLPPAARPGVDDRPEAELGGGRAAPSTGRPPRTLGRHPLRLQGSLSRMRVPLDVRSVCRRPDLESRSASTPNRRGLRPHARPASTEIPPRGRPRYRKTITAGRRRTDLRGSGTAPPTEADKMRLSVSLNGTPATWAP